MQRILRSIAVALLATTLLVPAALAADGDAPEPTAAVEATATPEPTFTQPPGQGEVVVDPTFIAPSPTPKGEVKAATGHADRTPPATDTDPSTIHAATTSGTGLQVLLVLGVAGSFLALVAVRPPAVRRR